MVAARNASEAQRQSREIEEIFRREYEALKSSASRERTRINEIHETHLDLATNKAKTDANEKLIRAWNSKPVKVRRRRRKKSLGHANIRSFSDGNSSRRVIQLFANLSS